MSIKHTLEIQETPEGELFIEFPDDVINAVGWVEGDTINWDAKEDGSYLLTKVETQWVLVEAVSTFRTRYMVQVPIGTDQYGKDKADWALDTVTMEEAAEFSQEHLGEQIVSHRVLSKEEALKMCDTDNDYTKDWDTDLKLKTFFTPWKETDE